MYPVLCYFFFCSDIGGLSNGPILTQECYAADSSFPCWFQFEGQSNQTENNKYLIDEE